MKKRSKLSKTEKIIIFVMIIFFLAVAGLVFLYFGDALGISGLFPEGFFDFSRFTVPDDGAEDLEGIIAKYEPVFTELQSEAIERLEELYQAAIAEYREQSAAGTLNRFRLTNKYLQAGRLLENNVNDAFFMLLDGLEKELISKNLPVDVVSEIKEAYEQTKLEKKEELFDRVRKQIGR
jgi:hypothetical protein